MGLPWFGFKCLGPSISVFFLFAVPRQPAAASPMGRAVAAPSVAINLDRHGAGHRPQAPISRNIPVFRLAGLGSARLLDWARARVRLKQPESASASSHASAGADACLAPNLRDPPHCRANSHGCAPGISSPVSGHGLSKSRGFGGRGIGQGCALRQWCGALRRQPRSASSFCL